MLARRGGLRARGGLRELGGRRTRGGLRTFWARVKVVLLGGSSFSTPALFAELARCADLDRGAELGRGAGLDRGAGHAPACRQENHFVLVGRSAKRLAAVARAARLLAGEHAPSISSQACTPDTARDALRDADVVMVQMRVGGMRGRAFDESFPMQFGLCGDEGLGPGGLSAAWRSWPTLERWLAAIAAHAARALVLMVSSPVGILTRAAHLNFPALRCFGVCEVPFVALREMGDALTVDVQRMQFDYFGVNHLGWLYGVRSGGRDLVSEWADLPGRSGFPSATLITQWGGVPTKYLRLHFETAAVLCEQRAAEPRAVALERLQTSALSTYGSGSLGQIRQSLRRRNAPWYSDSIAPLLHALATGAGEGPFFLSAPNQGYSRAANDDDVLEMRYGIRGHVPCAIPAVREPPAPLAECVRSFLRYERIATDAIIARSSDLLESALAAHPWVIDPARANPCLVPSLAQAIGMQAARSSRPTQPAAGVQLK